MSLNVKIDLEDVYETEPVSEDLLVTRFDTELVDNSKMPIIISIREKPLDLLPNVHNLAFGPMNASNGINDQIKIAHMNHSKMFSTIILSALNFLNSNTDKYLGIDGSTNARTYLYFRILQSNYDILSKYFEIYGVKYYVRILRKVRDEDDLYPTDVDDIIAESARLTKGERIGPEKMYNYFIFKAAQKFN